MTTDLIDLSMVRDAATAAAAALSRALPGGPAPEAPRTDADDAVPGLGARVLRAPLAGGTLSGELLVMVSAALADELWEETGSADVSVSLAPAVPAAVEALAALLGVLQPGEPTAETDAPAALASLTAPVTVRLLAAGTHVATLVLAIAAAPVLEAEAEPEPEPVDVPAPRAASFPSLDGLAGGAGADRSLDLLRDVEMEVTAELGRTRMTVRELLSLSPGAVVELDRAAGSPVDVLVNGTLIARGEVVVLDEEYGIRIIEVVGAAQVRTA